MSCYGNATIVEVAFQEKAINEKDEVGAQKTKTEEEMSSLSKKWKQLTNDNKKNNARIEVVESEQKMLDDYSKCISHVGYFSEFTIDFRCFMNSLART